MRIISYVVRYDVGFAPNPFHGFCTLATCRSDIRKRAQVGDWIVGTGSAEKKRAGQLVYAMQVSETADFDSYWQDPRFLHKQADLHGSRKVQHGDNIYHRDTGGLWLQANSRHSKVGGSVEPRHVKKDTATDRVLIGEKFVYFGGEGPEVPGHLRTGWATDLVHQGIGDHYTTDPVHALAAIQWIESLGTGVRGRPRDWPNR